MDAALNPYAPGAGRQPSELAGRENQIKVWTDTIKRSQTGKDNRPLALTGMRGVGKTVLLAQFAALAREADWIVGEVEVIPKQPLGRSLSEAFYPALVDIAQPSIGDRLKKALKTFASFKASYSSDGSWHFGLDLDESRGGGADTGHLEQDLGKLFIDLQEGADEAGTGVAVLIDEAQDLSSDDMAALSAALQVSMRRSPHRLIIAVAGLPSLPGRLAEARSYAERQFTYHDIGPLDSTATEQAITQPARNEGVEWDADAVAYIHDESAGYPFFVQQFGDSTWNTATGSPITLTDTQIGVAHGQRELDNGFFKARWDRATEAERAYMRAMTEDDPDVSQSGQIARRLGRKPQSLGPARANLINKGLIYAPEHGQIAFTVPKMADFINRQHET